MTTRDDAWLDGACALVDAHRTGDRSPLESVEVALDAIEHSSIGAFSFVDAEGARAAARKTDVDLPFGGVPIGVKELFAVDGWPDTKGSAALADRVAGRDSTVVARLRAAGAIPVGLTTSPEFGSALQHESPMAPTTRNPWQLDRSPGGSSAGAAAAVAGGLVPLSVGSDGGGSIRVPASLCGLPGLKVTYGRIPAGPGALVGGVHSVPGVLTRSVRDVARFLDVANGYEPSDPFSLPRLDGWESGLGSQLGREVRITILPGFAGTVAREDVAELAVDAAELLCDEIGARRVRAPVELPTPTMDWMLSLRSETVAELDDRYPDCRDELTPSLRLLLDLVEQRYDVRLRARMERQRRDMVEALACVFEETDVVATVTQPDVAYALEGWPDDGSGGAPDAPVLNRVLPTIPANMAGVPAITLPVGTVRGLPVGLQLMAQHHREGLLLDLASVVERVRPWPLVAPGAPC